MKILHLLAVVLLGAVYPAGAELGRPREALGPHQPGHVLVKYRQGTSEVSKERGRGRHRARRLRAFADLRIDHLEIDPAKGVAQALRELEADPEVEYAEPDYVLHAMQAPNDPQYWNLWGLSTLRTAQAWDRSRGSASVVVAVIDTGIDPAHPDLARNLWVNEAERSGRPGVDDDGNGVVDDVNGFNAVRRTGNPADDNGHGTHVAGTIGAVGNNALGVVGVNWDVRVVACKFMDASGSGSTSDAIACLQYVRALKNRGVNIVATNNSWGGSGYSQSLRDAIRAQGDILFIAAAGNSGNDNDAAPMYPASFALPNLVSVASTGRSDGLSSFSCYGRRSVAVGAPGESILSTVPGGSYGYKSGTSMATPHVTGLAALLAAADPARDWRDVKNLILSTGTSVPALAGKTLTGRRIDALSALACSNSAAFSIAQLPGTLQVGVPTILSALSINCADPVGPVTVTLSGGELVTLRDDGISPDLAAGDGLFSASWTPTRTGETFLFASTAGSQSAAVGPVAAPSPAVTTSALPGGTVGAAYSQTLTASGGRTPYAWSLSAGSLPAGLGLSAAGVISGVPSAAQTASFTVRVADAGGASATKVLSLAVASAPLAIVTGGFPAATLGSAYSQSLGATGGVQPYAWTVASGALPPGLALNASTGHVAGTPTAGGTYSFTVRLSDARGTSATKTFSVLVQTATGSALPSGTVGTPYRVTFRTPGVAPFTWSIAAGALPPGLALGTTTGSITGTPTRAGTYSFTVRVRDAAGTTKSGSFYVVIR